MDGHYYLSRMERMEGHISHEGCSERACTARNVDWETYRQRHVCGDGWCEVREVDVEAVVRFTEEGNVPVVEWDAAGGKLTVTRPKMAR